jgi:methanogenic corrinoid protein MtbC1
MERLLSSAFGYTPGNHARPGATAMADTGDVCRAAMRQVIETQIMPRLLQVTRQEGAAATQGPMMGPSIADVEAFAQTCAAGDRAACHALVQRLRADGLQPEHLLVELVAPAARYLGQRWDDDTLDFTSVTSGLMLMHEVVHAFGYEVHDGPRESGEVRRVMLASAPGSQHLLGLSIVSEFFRNAGWQVVLEVSPSGAALARAVGNEWFDLVGLSVALDSQLTDLPDLVGRLRAASRNPLVPVMLGGPVFLMRDLSAEQFGAQAVCLDARESLSIAEALVDG